MTQNKVFNPKITPGRRQLEINPNGSGVVRNLPSCGEDLDGLPRKFYATCMVNPEDARAMAAIPEMLEVIKAGRKLKSGYNSYLKKTCDTDITIHEIAHLIRNLINSIQELDNAYGTIQDD